MLETHGSTNSHIVFPFAFQTIQTLVNILVDVIINNTNKAHLHEKKKKRKQATFNEPFLNEISQRTRLASSYWPIFQLACFLVAYPKLSRDRLHNEKNICRGKERKAAVAGQWSNGTVMAEKRYVSTGCFGDPFARTWPGWSSILKDMHLICGLVSPSPRILSLIRPVLATVLTVSRKYGVPWEFLTFFWSLVSETKWRRIQNERFRKFLSLYLFDVTSILSLSKRSKFSYLSLIVSFIFKRFLLLYQLSYILLIIPRDSRNSDSNEISMVISIVIW